MNGIDDFIFNKEFDNVEDLEIEERKNKYTPIEELEEDGNDQPKEERQSKAKKIVGVSLLILVLTFIYFYGYIDDWVEYSYGEDAQTIVLVIFIISIVLLIGFPIGISSPNNKTAISKIGNAIGHFLFNIAEFIIKSLLYVGGIILLGIIAYSFL